MKSDPGLPPRKPHNMIESDLVAPQLAPVAVGIIDERKKIGGIDHITVNLRCYGLIGRFLRWCGLLRIEYDLFMLGSPEYVGKLPPHVEVECDCDHEPAGERVVFDTSTGNPHTEAGWFVVHESCSKCRRVLRRELRKDVILGDGSSLRGCLETQRRNGL